MFFRRHVHQKIKKKLHCHHSCITHASLALRFSILKLLERTINTSMTQTQLHIIVVVTFPLSSVSLQVLSKQVEQGRYPMAVSLDSFPFAIDTTAGCMYVQAIVYVLFYYLFIDDIDVLYRKTPAVDLHETIVILCS